MALALLSLSLALLLSPVVTAISLDSSRDALKSLRTGATRVRSRPDGGSRVDNLANVHSLETLTGRGQFYAIQVANYDARVSNAAPEALEFELLQLSPREVASTLSSAHPLSLADALSRSLRERYPDSNTGWAYYADTYTEDGWYRLEIRTDQDAPFPDVVKARAAGFVEGNLQAAHMYRFWSNYRKNQYAGRGEAPSKELYAFLDEQYAWMTKRVEAATGWSLAHLRGQLPLPRTAGGSSASNAGLGRGRSKRVHDAADGAGDDQPQDVDPGVRRWRPQDDDDGGSGSSSGSGGSGTASGAADWDRRYWSLVGLVAAQFEGLAAGFWASTPDPARNMTWHELYTLNAVGDLYELNVLFPPPNATVAAAAAATEQQLQEQQQPEAPERHYTPGHGEVGEYGYGELLDCSAIIKIADVDPDSDGSSRADAVLDSMDDPTSIAARLLGRRGGAAGARRRGVLGVEEEEQEEEEAELGVEGAGVRRRRGRDFWAAHNTWRSYYDMVRTWKVYDFPWSATGPVVVSSSPGLLHSKDDWYTTDSLVVMETTNGIYNKSLYDAIQPHSVLMWQRAQVSNFGAVGGADWVDLFARHNSGTYNNQWMVLDVDLLQRGREHEVLWVLEQLPGLTVSADVSKVLLGQGFWASYNVPYFPEIYNLTAYPQPSIYHTCPRARIFKREQSRVTSTYDLMSLMRYNHYTEDPDSLGLPNNAIAARYDLPARPDSSGAPRNYTRRAYGAVDAKIVDFDSFSERRTYVINGPTSDDQPVFRWSTADTAVAGGVHHEGCVDEFKFGWQSYASVMGPIYKSGSEPDA